MDSDSSARLFMQIISGGAFTSGGEIQIILYLIILFLLIFFSAAFTATEIAVITLNDNKIRQSAEDGDRTSKRILKYIDGPSHFLSTIHVGVNFATFLASALAAVKFVEPLTQLLDPNGNYPLLKMVSVLVVTILFSYFVSVFADLVPKRVAMKYPVKVIKYTLGLLIIVGTLLRPFVFVLTATSNAILRLIGINPDEHERRVTEEEIRMMISVGRETGTIHETEKEMIENIFELNDTQVSEIMTHRTDLVSLNCEAPFDEVLAIAVSEKFTRIPVYKDSIDNIIGILHIKDLLNIAVEGLQNPFNLRSLIREPIFVPETKTIDEVFRQMQTEHAQIAVVIDEYGGTAGIITVEDLLEEIVGNMQDEYDEEEEEIIRQDEFTIIVEGKTALDEIEDEINVRIPENGDYDTIAGFFMDLLGRIPEEDENAIVTFENLTMQVLEMSDRRIMKIKIIIHPKEDVNDEETENIDNDNKKSDNGKNGKKI